MLIEVYQQKTVAKQKTVLVWVLFLCRGSLARKLYVSGVTQLISGLKRLQNTSFIILIFFSLVFAKPSRVSKKERRKRKALEKSLVCVFLTCHMARALHFYSSAWFLQVLLIKRKQTKKPTTNKTQAQHFVDGNAFSRWKYEQQGAKRTQCRIAKLHHIIMNFSIQTLLQTGEIWEGLTRMWDCPSQ